MNAQTQFIKTCVLYIDYNEIDTQGGRGQGNKEGGDRLGLGTVIGLRIRESRRRFDRIDAKRIMPTVVAIGLELLRMTMGKTCVCFWKRG